MVRGALRPYLVGICVFTVSFALLSVVFRHPERRPNEQAWSSRQRASIVTGAVREKPAEAASATAAPKDDAPAQAAITEEASAPAVVEPKRVEKPVVEERRTRTARAHAAANAPRVAKREEATPTVKPDAPQPVIEAAPAPAPVIAPPVEAPAREEATRSVVEQTPTPPVSTPPPPPQVIAPKAAPPTDAAAPKTRQQVEDELRRARSSGALPKFGNPNPAGPGGVPSDTTKSP